MDRPNISSGNDSQNKYDYPKRRMNVLKKETESLDSKMNSLSKDYEELEKQRYDVGILKSNLHYEKENKNKENVKQNHKKGVISKLEVKRKELEKIIENEEKNYHNLDQQYNAASNDKDNAKTRLIEKENEFKLLKGKWDEFTKQGEKLDNLLEGKRKKKGGDRK